MRHFLAIAFAASVLLTAAPAAASAATATTTSFSDGYTIDLTYLGGCPDPDIAPGVLTVHDRGVFHVTQVGAQSLAVIEAHGDFDYQALTEPLDFAGRYSRTFVFNDLPPGPGAVFAATWTMSGFDKAGVHHSIEITDHYTTLGTGDITRQFTTYNCH